MKKFGEKRIGARYGVPFAALLPLSVFFSYNLVFNLKTINNPIPLLIL